MEMLAWSGQAAAAIREYEKLRQYLRGEMGLEPDPATYELADLIRTRRFHPPETGDQTLADTPTIKGNRHYIGKLPADTTPFIGRERELSQIADLLLDQSSRLITIAGPGGAGKTRLAVAAAAQQSPATSSDEKPFEDGVFFVPLAPLSHPEEIVSALGRVLDCSIDQQENAERQLIEFLCSKSALIVLDNYEHVLDKDSAGLPARILEGAPGVKIVVTSRSRLGSQVEHVVTLGGLDIVDLPFLAVETDPDGDGEQVLREREANPAITLFKVSARRVQPGFEVTAENVLAIAQITRLVDGLPLGIELAAGWLELYTPAEIVSEVEQSADFLASGLVDVPERQSSLRAVFDSSWRNLSESEKRALAALSIFKGGFERHAAEVVVDASPHMMQSLVNKSWLQHAGGRRFQMHELLRQYTAAQLASVASDYESALERHADYYADYVSALDKRVMGPEPGSALVDFSADLDNIHAAWHWYCRQGRVSEAVRRMLPGLFRHAETRFNFQLIHSIVDSGLDSLDGTGRDDAAVRFALRTARNTYYGINWPFRLRHHLFAWPDEKSDFTDTWALAEGLPPMPLWTPLAASLVGHYVDYEVGHDSLRKLVDDPPPDFSVWDLTLVRQLLGGVISAEGPDRLVSTRASGPTPATGTTDDPLLLLEEALSGFRQLGDIREEAYTLLSIGFHHHNRGQLGSASASLHQAIDILLKLGEPSLIASVENELGYVQSKMGDFSGTLTLWESATDRFLSQGRLEHANGQLSKLSFEALRYATPEYALQFRQRALAISRKTGRNLAHGWDLWEMGEIYRIMGDYATARDWYDQAVSVFKAGNDQNGSTFYHRGLGEIALGRGDYAEADRQLRISLQLADELNHPWSMVYAARGLSEVAMGMGRLSAARNHLVVALCVILERSTVPGDTGGLYLSVFASAVRLFHELAMEEEAGRLARYVLDNPLTWGETRRNLERLALIPQDDRRVSIKEDMLKEFMVKCLELRTRMLTLTIPS